LRIGTNAIQREAQVSKPTVWRWQKAYMDGGVERLLKDRGKGPRAGKKPISAEVRLAIVTRTAKEKPKHATHWSARMLAEEIGIGHTTVQRVWNLPRCLAVKTNMHLAVGSQQRQQSSCAKAHPLMAKCEAGNRPPPRPTITQIYRAHLPAFAATSPSAV
jgi:hypothetical protein